MTTLYRKSADIFGVYTSFLTKEDSEGLKADELREILLTVKGIGPAKAENIMEAVGKALAEKG